MRGGAGEQLRAAAFTFLGYVSGVLLASTSVSFLLWACGMYGMCGGRAGVAICVRVLARALCFSPSRRLGALGGAGS